MSAPQWQLDPTRNEYYYFNHQQQAYIYQNGRVIRLATATQTQPRTTATTSTSHVSPSAPRTVPPVHPSQVTNPSSSAADPTQNLAHLMQQATLSGGLNTSNYQTYGGGASAQAYGPRYSQAASTAGAVAGSESQTVQTTPNEQITDPRLLKLGIGAKGRIRGAFGDSNRLYPEFQVRRPGKKFFKRGKVFKVLWPEILGQANESITVTSDTKYGEGIATKIRWFVVVMESTDCCTCLPINTYKGQGVAKRGVTKWHHAIAYSSREEPDPEPDERARPGESTMMVGIRIKPKRRGDKLDKMSRIDFARMYTVEHNVKVYDFGNVHTDSLERLVQQWLLVIQAGVTNNPILPAPTDDEEGESDSEEEEDEDEDEASEEDDEPQPPPRRGHGKAPAASSSSKGYGHTASGNKGRKGRTK